MLPLRAKVDLGAMAINGILRIPQSSSITGTSPSDCLVSYPGHSSARGGSYLSAEVQSVYSTAPADWAMTTFGRRAEVTIPTESSHTSSTRDSLINVLSQNLISVTSGRYDRGLVLMDRRVVIPKFPRRKILHCLHATHQGVNGMKVRANDTVYWPGMNASTCYFRANCATIAPSQPREAIIMTPAPEWPFQQIVMDIFHVGHVAYLVPPKIRSCHHIQVDVHLSAPVPNIRHPRQTQYRRWATFHLQHIPRIFSNID